MLRRIAWSLASVSMVAACGAEAYEPSSEASLTVELELSDSGEVDEVSYVISGNGIDPIVGTIDTSAPDSTASVEVFGIPPGQRYLLELLATTTDAKTKCEGAERFDVAEGETTELTVFLRCKVQERYGGVRVDGTVNICAELVKAVASPLQASLSNGLSLSAQGSDADGDPIAYRWNATGGSIFDPSSPATAYTCDDEGVQRITIQVSDDGFEACVDGWTFEVTCVGDGGGGEVAPALVGSHPVPESLQVRTIWPTLTFAEPVADGVLDRFSLSCGPEALIISAHRLRQDPHTVVINPAVDLPADSRCDLSWPGPLGSELLSFFVHSAAPLAVIPYDRTDPSRYAPFPDDIWLTSDPSTETGARVDLPIPDREPDVQIIFGSIKEAAGQLDGFSPIGALVVELPDAPDASSLPRTQEASLDPLATVGLFDLTPGSPSYGKRVPFKLHIRSARTASIAMQHALVMFPSIPLTPASHYGLVVTKRALVAPDRPFDPSAFTLAALGDPIDGEDSSIRRSRLLIREVLDVLSKEASPPIFEDDVAMVTRFSIRSTSGFPLTPLTMKQQVLDLPPPTFRITSITPDFSTSEVAAIVKGTWEAPDWRDGISIRRDSDGRPIVTSTKEVPFVVAIPKAAESAPVSITMYQHGNPGSAENEVPGQARSYMAENGFAVMGFTDTITREVGAAGDFQTLATLVPLFISGILPDFWSQTTGEQLSFLRLIEQLGELDVVPLGVPDGQPDLDVHAAFSYIGISEGANKGQAFVPYAPEMRAVALVVGGMRLGEVLFFQDPIGPGGVGTRLLDNINAFLAPSARPVDLWVGFSLFQLAFDPQDPHNHAAFMYANPLEVAGTFRKPSVLVQEGIADTLVPNNATRSLAYTLGPVPHIAPIRVPISYLPVADGPLMGNIDSVTTSAYAQYVPAGLPDLEPTPTCISQPEGHFCAQIAASAKEQRVHFFQTAISDSAPTIVNPF